MSRVEPLEVMDAFTTQELTVNDESSRHLAEQLRRRFTQQAAATAEWAEVTLDLAVIFAEARQMFPSNIAFGHWLVENELDKWGKDDQAALIHLGQHIELAREVMECSSSQSVRLIWEAVQHRLEPSPSSQRCEDDLPSSATEMALVPVGIPKSSIFDYYPERQPQVDESWREHWQDMPEFVQDELKPYAEIRFRFASEAALQDCAARLEQKLTRQTKSAWHPRLERGFDRHLVYVDVES
jgi:hypothetical protein